MWEANGPNLLCAKQNKYQFMQKRQKKEKEIVSVSFAKDCILTAL